MTQKADSMIELCFSLDFDATLFTGEGNFKVDKDGNPWDITYLVRGDVKKYENVSFNRPRSIRVTEETIGSNSLFDLINRNIWASVFNRHVPYRHLHNYKDPMTCGEIAVYHETSLAGITNPFIWLLRSQSSQVLEGIWGHRTGINPPVESCSDQVCISVGDYFVDSDDDKVETFVFSGPIDKMARVADFLDYLGTPSFRFLADPVVLVPSGSPESVFDREVERMSEMMEWVSAGEYWSGGVVARHRENSCECPLCLPELITSLFLF